MEKTFFWIVLSLSVVGLTVYLIFFLRSLIRLTDAATQTLKNTNETLPQILANTQHITESVTHLFTLTNTLSVLVGSFQELSRMFKKDKTANKTI